MWRYELDKKLDNFCLFISRWISKRMFNWAVIQATLITVGFDAAPDAKVIDVLKKLDYGWQK